MNKLIFSFITVVLVSTVILSCAPALAPGTTVPTVAPSPSATQPITIKHVSFLPKTHAMMKPIHEMIARIEKATNGQIKFDWPGGPEVIPAFDQPDALKKGVIQANFYLPGNYMQPLMPEVFAASLSPYPAWEERTNGVYDLWVELCAKKVNVKYLGRLESLVPGFFFYTVNKPIKKVDDIKGLNLRTSPLYVPFVQKLGAAAVTIQSDELSTALSRGVVNGMVQAAIGIHAYGWDETLRYMIKPGFGQLDNFCVINMDVWNKIPKNLQDIIMAQTKDLEKWCTDELMVRYNADWAACQKAGMQEIVMEPAEGQKLLDIVNGSLWENVLKNAPEYGPKLQALMIKK